MNRIRLRFLLVLLALGIPLILLSIHALNTVEAQEQGRHDAIAARIFDEMERTLSTLLEREEKRPFDHYRHLFEPENNIGGVASLSRSPLAQPSDLPYVLGHFQIDPDGSFNTPLRVSPSERVQLNEDNPYEHQGERIAEQIEALITSQWPSTTRSGLGGLQQVAQVNMQLPGQTLQVKNSPSPLGSGNPQQVAQNSNDLQLLNADPINWLNRGIDTRAGRKDTIKKTAPSKTQAFTQQSALPTKAVDVELEPMVARPLSQRWLLLYRTVWVDKQAYRQGLVLDVEALMDWLDEQILNTTPLQQSSSLQPLKLAGGSAALGRFDGGRYESPETFGGGGDYHYRHRFAEPFADLAGSLVLEPLGTEAGTTWIRLVVFLAMALALISLSVLYRGVMTQLQYAQRRSDFVAAVTHELRTPLTAIRMYGEMLRDGIVPSEEKRYSYYETITSEAERLSRLINNVLELSQLERRTRSVNLASGHLQPVISQVVGTLEPHAKQRGFSFDIDLPQGLPSLYFDGDALVQVLFNLVDNALKYAASAEDKRISLKAALAEGGVVLTVRDRGPGVPEAHLRHVFEPFYRGERELTRQTQGTGIGLALVDGLGTRMGAKISGHNHPDGGFEVKIWLPVAR